MSTNVTADSVDALLLRLRHTRVSGSAPPPGGQLNPGPTARPDMAFCLPAEALLAPVMARFPCREAQIRSLATLLHPLAAPCPAVVIHGPEATGKSVTVAAVLGALADSCPDSLARAVVDSARCVTARHLLERIGGAVAEVLLLPPPSRRCESLAQLCVELQRMLPNGDRGGGGGGSGQVGARLVLVLDGIDRQREAPATLLPGLARLPEMISRLTCVFVITAAHPSLFRTAPVPHVDFPAYTGPEFVTIMTATTAPPPAELPPSARPADVAALWARFCAAVHDALARPAARTLPALRRSCRALWPRFTAPVRAGTAGPRDFSRLLIAARIHFQDESLLYPGLGSSSSSSRQQPSSSDLSTLLPRTARLILLAAYLASHNPSRHDLTLFSTFHHRGRRRRGGGGLASGGRPRGKHRKIARRLLGAHSFALERMMAIFAAVRAEWVGGGGGGGGGAGGWGAGLDGDVAMAVSTLASLRLLTRVGASGDLLDRGGKWRINVGWDVVRGVGRSIGVELEEWLME